MFSTLRTRFGIPGVISVIALVFAMFGGAYAASNSSGGKATASAKAKKGPRGPKGATGPAGPAGAQGPAGPAGAKGDTGAAGANGTNGANGESVTTTPIPTSSTTCNKSGGAEFRVGSGAPTTACNGKAGAPGPPGPTCTNGECLLPEGATETGVWTVRESGRPGATSGIVNTAISYPLRLDIEAEAVEAFPAHYLTSAEGEAGGTTECPGNASNPKAEPENLCVYAAASENFAGLPYMNLNVDLSSGRVLSFFKEIDPEQDASAYGSWAVTGPVSAP